MKRLGIDIGSTTVKVAVIDEEHNILFSEYKRHFANIKETLKELVEHASKELGNVEVAPTITGSRRRKKNSHRNRLVKMG